MVRRRGVIAGWELRPNSPDGFALQQVFADAVQRASADPTALVYGNSLAMSVDGIDAGWNVRARFMTLRSRDSAPIQYNPSSGLTPISIPNNSYIADVMHLIVRSDNIVIYDRHDDGPTLSELGEYLRDFLRAPVNVVSLYNRNLQTDLRDMEGQFRKIDLGFLTAQIEATGGGLLSSAKRLWRGEDIPSVSVSLGMGRTGRRDEYLPADLQQEAMEIAGEAGELVERMVIVGRRRSTGKIDKLNILRQRIGDHLEILPSALADTMPDADDAYLKLNEMFEDNRRRGIISSALSARFLFQ